MIPDGKKLNNAFSVLIIGAGKIGAFFDNPQSEAILTHAHAFKKDESFHLRGFVDIDAHRCTQAANLWGCKAYSSVEEAFKEGPIDVICVAVPDEYHDAVLREIVNYHPKIVLSEKPLTKTLHQSEEIIALYQKKAIPIILNYTRRFVPDFETLKENIQIGQYGNYLSGTGYYGKGISHNGSHMLDLLRFLFGNLEIRNKINTCADQYPDDPSVAAVLFLKNQGFFYLQHIDCRAYTLFEIDLCFEKKRIRIINSGFDMEEYDVYNSPIFEGYQVLNKTGTIKTQFSKALENVVTNIKLFLLEQTQLKCNAEDGLEVLRLCERLKETR